MPDTNPHLQQEERRLGIHSSRAGTDIGDRRRRLSLAKEVMLCSQLRSIYDFARTIAD
ncbi:MAG: hypothetical protein MHM6MM_001659 [Cercozoa sp. M6MM]